MYKQILGNLIFQNRSGSDTYRVC